MIELGLEVKDKITGFTGIVIGKAEYLTGCNQYGICPTVDADGKKRDTEWFDEGRLLVIGEGVSKEEVSVEQNGGPNRDAPRG